MNEKTTNKKKRDTTVSFKKLNEDALNAFESCINALSLNELSRVTGVRIELLRRYISKNTRKARAETWDKIYPSLKPFLVGPEPATEPPLRVGATYRRHHELVDMFSDQKVLLDEFEVLSDKQQKEVINWMAKLLDSTKNPVPSSYESLTPAENQVMGVFLALDPEKREQAILSLTKLAIVEVRKRRNELF